MLALVAANVVGVVLFGTVYALAGARFMSQSAFLACLLLIFLLVTSLWVRVEARHRGLDPIRRLGRAAAGLVVVILAVPVAVLWPAFWLDTQLPPEADFTRHLAPVMTLVLISLGLVVLANLVGSVVACVRGLFATRR
jgi:hypothetical protein